MAERGADLVKALFKMGTVVTVNQTIDQDTAELLVTEFGHNIKRVSESDVDIQTETDVDADRDAAAASAGGHDHGPRRSRQDLAARRDPRRQRRLRRGRRHHPAYRRLSGDLPDKSKITFLDTPGHEAFTEMRARGANVTDIVVLVVAADDGLKPQTVEAINHTKAAGVPMIVAINKIDKPAPIRSGPRGAAAARDRGRGLGGDVQDVEVSALKKTNLDGCSRRSPPGRDPRAEGQSDRAAEGTVVEAKLDKGRGPLATVLVQRGTLRSATSSWSAPIPARSAR
jgi:translation initiation factor IF-2